MGEKIVHPPVSLLRVWVKNARGLKISLRDLVQIEETGEEKRWGVINETNKGGENIKNSRHSVEKVVCFRGQLG